MDDILERVAGGYHAADRQLQITVFGKTQAEAIAALDKARRRAIRLDTLATLANGTPITKRSGNETDGQQEET